MEILEIFERLVVSSTRYVLAGVTASLLAFVRVTVPSLTDRLQSVGIIWHVQCLFSYVVGLESSWYVQNDHMHYFKKRTHLSSCEEN